MNGTGRQPAPRHPPHLAAATSINPVVSKTVTTTHTLTQDQVEEILRKAVGAPPNAIVCIENGYLDDITITHSETITNGD